MKKTSCFFISVLLIFTLLTVFPTVSAFAEPEDDEVVFSEAELADWCELHQDSGGTVTLGEAITLTSVINNYGEGTITIDTGAFGLVYNGGSIAPVGFEIIGEGVDMPVIDIYNAGLFRTGWQEAIQRLIVTATGRDGQGGVAVRVRNDDGWGVNFDHIQYEGAIRAFGSGAVGLYLDAPMEVFCFNVSAEGEGALAVYAEQGSSLYYCKLFSDGEGAFDTSGGDILLDTCAAENLPGGIECVNRTIVELSGRRFYLPLKQDGGLFFFNSKFTFLLSGGETLVTQDLLVEWERDLLSTDTSVIGKTVIRGSLLSPFQGLGLEGDFPLELIVDVRDPSLPCISELDFHENIDGGKYARLVFWDSCDPADGLITLWRSDDGGLVWYDFTGSSDLDWNGDTLYFYYTDLEKPVMLQLEVAGAGESNVVTLYDRDGVSGGSLGGDRTGTDRNTSNPDTPWYVFIPDIPGDDAAIENPPQEPDPNTTGKTDDTVGSYENDTETVGNTPDALPEGDKKNNATTTIYDLDTPSAKSPFPAPMILEGGSESAAEVPPVRPMTSANLTLPEIPLNSQPVPTLNTDRLVLFSAIAALFLLCVPFTVKIADRVRR